MLSIEELLELEDNIKAELDEYLTAALSKLNRSGQLEEFIELLGMEHLLQKESGYEVYKTGKIVVIGQSDVKVEALLSVPSHKIKVLEMTWKLLRIFYGIYKKY